MIVKQLLQALSALLPTDVLEKNRVGNLIVIRDDRDIGWLDLTNGTFEPIDEEREPNAL